MFASGHQICYPLFTTFRWIHGDRTEDAND